MTREVIKRAKTRREKTIVDLIYRLNKVQEKHGKSHFKQGVPPIISVSNPVLPKLERTGFRQNCQKPKKRFCCAQKPVF